MTDDSDVTETDMSEMDAKLSEFQVFIKKAIPHFKKMQATLAGFLGKKQQVMKSYAGMADQLVDYENNNLAFYRNQVPEDLIFALTEFPRLDDELKKAVTSLKNPFVDLYHWIKGEVYDLNAFAAALSGRKAIKSAIADLEKKITSTKSDVENVTMGKKTVGTLFKNTGDIHKM